MAISTTIGKNLSAHGPIMRLRLQSKDTKLRIATLLTCIGSEAMEVFDGFQFDNEDEKDNINIVIEKFQAYCIGKQISPTRDTSSIHIVRPNMKALIPSLPR